MSKKENFTAGRIVAFRCADGKQQSIFWDAKTPGLGLRVTAAGAKSYIFEACLHSKTIRITIGDVRTYSVAQAQAEATTLRGLCDKGIDPRELKAEQRAKSEALKAERKRKSVTVGEAWAEYVAARQHVWGEAHAQDHAIATKAGGEPRGRGRRAGQGAVTYPGLIYPLLSLRLSELTASRVQEWLEVANLRGKTAAAKAFRLLRAFLNWCGDRDEYSGIVSANAHSKREVRDIVQKVRAKKLVLQREQLPLFFESVRKIGNPTAAAYLQVLLLTGARREELAQLRWADCDFQWRTLHIKDKVSPAGRDIPMTPYVASLLMSQPRRYESQPRPNESQPRPIEFVFSSPLSAAGYLADPLTPLQRAMLAAGLPNLSPHDLRRSFGTLAEWVEVPAGVVAQLMGHQPSAIAEKHYIVRPLDLLRSWHVKIEAWILEQAGVTFDVEQAGKLRAVK
ncbi:MAG: integrase family protein [Thiobacillus sp.]|nr:integrase family protein [Thiobacillus sp.]